MSATVPLKSYESDEKTRTAVDQLRILLNAIYPEPSADIFTLDDFINRYPLTGLGDLAIREIEQSVRINNSLNNYDQIGLCEFHIALIYLYWGDFRGAINQFDSARKKWGFAGVATTSSLCYFAMGIGYYLALHYEDALRCYGLAERALDRINIQQNDFYYHELSAYIEDEQTNARDAAWARVRVKPADEAPSQPADPPDEPVDEPADVPPDEPVPPEAPAEDAEPQERVEPVPMPQTHLPLSMDIPFPGHLQSDPSYAWFQVETRSESNLYGDVVDGDWLLVQKQPILESNLQKEEPLLVLMDEDVHNAIHIRPDKLTRPYQRIYLAKCKKFEGSFMRDPDSGEVTLLATEPSIEVAFNSQEQQISVQWSSILGTVVGFWRKKPNGMVPVS